MLFLVFGHCFSSIVSIDYNKKFAAIKMFISHWCFGSLFDGCPACLFAGHRGLFTACLACLSHSVGSWILDSGASDHVVGNPFLISNLSPPKNTHNITLANGSKTQVTGIGQASPLPSLSLNYVLPILGSLFNLISISTLTRSLNRYITFSLNSLFK